MTLRDTSMKFYPGTRKEPQQRTQGVRLPSPRAVERLSSKAPKISLYFKFAFLSPALILLGILALIVPNVLTDQSFMMRGPNKLSVAGWALVVVLLVIGFGTYYLLDQHINSLGYK
jgi:membrane-associated PAP2 superfamily phosphatase